MDSFIGSRGVGWRNHLRTGRRHAAPAPGGVLGNLPALYCLLLALWAFLTAAWIFLR